MNRTWHDFPEDPPPKSGYYMVEDRKGRTFRTWYERTVAGFDMIHEGVGYKVIRWRHEVENMDDRQYEVEEDE